MLLDIVLHDACTSLAYLDPGTGSYIFQFLIAGLVGLVFTIKTFWRKLTMFFTKFFSRRQDAGQEEPIPLLSSEFQINPENQEGSSSGERIRNEKVRN